MAQPFFARAACSKSGLRFSMSAVVGAALAVGAHCMLCTTARPSEAVLELLPVGPLPPFTKEDGERVVDDGVRLDRR